ncbi:helix-turn-helix domain-containing protein [Microbacterium sp. NPDC089695]|uniref:helix-turn-helix domain-containing protein n=1 Tax=Microbacterium sp. NPDC089695 TaxID=3364198 RepID=UPI0037F2428D
MDADTAATLAAIGPRLRRLRTRRALTLDAASARAGLSTSTLSRIETGRRQPTLDVLLPLARVYEVSLDHLIAAPQTGDPRIHLEPRRLIAGGVAVHLAQNPGGMQVFKHVIGPREPVLVTHEGHAWISVLSGRLRLLLRGAEHVIEPGEIVEFDASSPHWFGPADDLSVEILHMFGPEGQRPTTRDVS